MHSTVSKLNKLRNELKDLVKLCKQDKGDDFGQSHCKMPSVSDIDSMSLKEVKAAIKAIKSQRLIDITFGQQLPIINTGYATQAKVVASPQATSFELHLNTTSHFTISISTILAQSWSFPKLLSIEDSVESPSCVIYLELEQDPTANNDELQNELETKASNDGLCCNCICMCSKRKGGILTLKVPLSSQNFLNLSRLLQLEKGSKHPPNCTPLPIWSTLIPPCLYSHGLVQGVDYLLKAATMLFALFAMITLVNNIDFLKDWIVHQWNNFINMPIIATIVLEMQSWWVAVIYPLTVLLNSGLANFKVLFTSCTNACSCCMPMFTCCGKYCKPIRTSLVLCSNRCMAGCKRMQECGGYCMKPCKTMCCSLIDCCKSNGTNMSTTNMEKAGTCSTLQKAGNSLTSGFVECWRCKCCGMNSSDTKVEDKKEK